ncbi:hypothetical protein IAU59_006384 [Kwoniella sp. CBS 9459]
MATNKRQRGRSPSSSLSPPPSATSPIPTTSRKTRKRKVNDVASLSDDLGLPHAEVNTSAEDDVKAGVANDTGTDTIKTTRAKRSKPQTRHKPTDEFQQVSRSDFVDRYKVDLGYGADVYYQADFLTVEEAGQWYDELLGLDTYQPTLKLYGKSFLQSRQIAAYSTTPSATLSYSGSTITMNYPFPPILEAIRTRLERELAVKFNHVMLNRYDDGSVYIGKHSDNLNNLVIASVSVGAERTFIMSPRMPSKARQARVAMSNEGQRGLGSNDLRVDLHDEKLTGRKNVKWVLGNGSLVVMQGRTQEFWKHEIPKEPSVKSGRISLTFRQLV